MRALLVVGMLVGGTFAQSSKAAPPAVDSVIIDSRLSEFDSIPPVRTDLRIYVGSVEKTYDDSVPNYLGRTRSSAVNFSSVFIEPSIDSSLKQSLHVLLKKKAIQADYRSEATHAVEIDVLNLEMRERGKLWQKLDILLKLEAAVMEMTDTTLVNRIVIETSGSWKGLDTTGRIEDVLHTAIESALRELLVGIAEN